MPASDTSRKWVYIYKPESFTEFDVQSFYWGFIM